MLVKTLGMFQGNKSQGSWTQNLVIKNFSNSMNLKLYTAANEEMCFSAMGR